MFRTMEHVEIKRYKLTKDSSFVQQLEDIYAEKKQRILSCAIEDVKSACLRRAEEYIHLREVRVVLPDDAWNVQEELKQALLSEKMGFRHAHCEFVDVKDSSRKQYIVEVRW